MAAVGRPPKENIWSADEWIDLPRLAISRVTFDGNSADQEGGAIAFSGQFAADGLVMRNNVAGQAGGAIAALGASMLPEPWQDVLPELAKATGLRPDDEMILKRSIVVDNRATDDGGALGLAGSESAIGNTIFARNASSGGAISGSRVRLVNSVVANNAAAGIAAPATAALTVGNVAIYSNSGGNCAPGTVPTAIGSSLQSPGGECGAAAKIANPGLDSGYAPGLVSAVRGAGDRHLCITDPVVGGTDLYGHTRALRDGRCSIGAIERDLTETVVAGSSFGKLHALPPWLWWCLGLLLFLLFLFALVRRCSHTLSL